MSTESELNWEEYEAITRYIYEMLGSRDGIKIKGHGRQCKVVGKSGVTHQVDVLTEQVDGGRQLLTAIECKYCKKKATKDMVMKLSEIMRDAAIASGIIVCRSGFTKDTLTYAEHLGIKLVELREAGENDAEFEKDVEIANIDLKVKVMLSRPKIISINFGEKIIQDEAQIMQMYHVNLHDGKGGYIPFGKFVSAFSEELQNREDPSETITKNYPLNFKLHCELTKEQIVTEKIAITGFLTKSDQSFTRAITLTDQVWMIMKEIFDNKTLALSKHGMMWNLSHEG